MSTINSVGTSSTTAASQYQDYLQRLQAAKKPANDSQDTPAIQKAEAADPLVDPDHDGK